MRLTPAASLLADGVTYWRSQPTKLQLSNHFLQGVVYTACLVGVLVARKWSAVACQFAIGQALLGGKTLAAPWDSDYKHGTKITFYGGRDAHLEV